jgi:hypothetical protein
MSKKISSSGEFSVFIYLMRIDLVKIINYLIIFALILNKNIPIRGRHQRSEIVMNCDIAQPQIAVEPLFNSTNIQFK